MIGDRIEVNIAGGLDVELPRMIRVRQKFETPRVDDVAGTVIAQFDKPDIRNRVKPGMRVAVGCGSRGIANVAECAGTVVAQLEALGAEPFIFPAMGSHGAASAVHWHGFDTFKDILPAAGKFIMEHKNFLFGVAMVENAEEETALVEIVPAEQVLQREPELLALSRQLMPRLQFDEIDVLVVDRMGKNITGAGMDPNIIGRNSRDVRNCGRAGAF